MANYNTVSKESNVSATAGIEAIRGLFKKAGFKISTKKHSALYSTYFTKDETVFILSGWHGDGSYGFGKSVFALYNGDARTLVPEFEFNREAPIDGAAQEDYIKTVIAFIKANI